MGVHHEVDTLFDLFLGEGRVTKQDCLLTELFRVLWQIMTFDAVQMNALRGGIFDQRLLIDVLRQKDRDMRVRPEASVHTGRSAAACIRE